MKWTFVLVGGPNHGDSGPLDVPFPRMRTPEAWYERAPLGDEGPREVLYTWVKP